MIVSYPIAISHKNNGKVAYGIAVPDFDGTCCSVVSAADEFEEIKPMAREAIELAFEEFLEQKQKLPIPTKLQEVMAKEDYKDWAWMMVEVEVPQELL